MLTAKMVKDQARYLGADLAGIAPMDRFEGAPKEQDPRYIFPGAKSCIVLAFRLPRGYFRGIEEGTYFQSYTFMGYGGLNRIYMPIVLRELCCYIEDHGYEAVPIPNYYSQPNISIPEQRPAPERSVPVAPGLPNPDILVDFRVAAFAAGLGQFGYSKVFLTPEFGPMQRFVLMLTDAELEPDPLYEGELCDRCMRCVGACSGKAISPHETQSITVAGKKVEWGKFDWLKCSIAYRGGSREYNPFLSKDARLDEISGEYCGGRKLQEWAGYPPVEGNNPALEGARGCIRECYIHLEESGRLTKKFHNKFRQRKPWRLG
jgi:epoxyqueuosine reductase